MSDPTTDPGEDLKTKSTAFILALTQPELSDVDIAWTGVQAVLAAMGTGTTFTNAQRAITRLRKLTVPTP